VAAQPDPNADPTAILGRLDQMDREHTAWRAVCRELEKAAVDIEEASDLHAAITLWGEELAQLRAEAPEYLAPALAEKRAAYNPYLIVGEDEPDHGT
jgi:hypothetical protein